jgi:ABC-type glycerol-3-phosphate transport system substrate-binding protein
VTVLPAHGQNLAGPILYTKVLAITNSFSPRQTAIALDFARFVTNKEQQKQRAMDLGAFILPDKTVILDKRLFPIEAILEQQARSAVGIPLDHISKAEIVFPIAESLYEQILTGAISPQEGGIELLKLVHQSSQKTQ